MMKHLLLLPYLILCMNLLAYSQGNEDAYSEKVQSLDAIIGKLYAVISGEKGEKRDWDLFTYLFYPNAKLIPVSQNQEGLYQPEFITSDTFISRAERYMEENGFYEQEIHRITNTFGNISQVFSTYESYHSRSDSEPFNRGINSIQLLNDGKRWWVINIYWTQETDENPIPEEYLP